MLTLDSARAMRDLGWQPALSLAEAVGWSADWFRSVDGGADAAELTGRQIDGYLARISPTRSRAAA